MNRQGIELLKQDLRASAAVYDQSTFGERRECGTFMCMAGMCHLRRVGAERYHAELAAYTRSMEDNILFSRRCLVSGLVQLGISRPSNVYLFDTPQIFDTVTHWPKELRWAYQAAGTSAERVEVACQALDLLREDGSIVRPQLRVQGTIANPAALQEWLEAHGVVFPSAVEILPIERPTAEPPTAQQEELVTA